MNNDLIYTLDPVIIRIIFQVKTDDEALEVYNELANGVNTVYEETVREYLLENSFNEEDIQIILNAVEFENLPAKYKPYVQNVILLKKIENNTKLFLKTYYDQLLPKLSAESKKSLEDYIKESEELIKARQEETRAGLQLMKKILEDNGVNNYDELKEKFANQPKNNEPKVSLGGIQTTNLPEPVQPVEPIVNAAPEVQEPVLTNEPIQPATPSIDTVPATPQVVVNAEPVQAPVEVVSTEASAVQPAEATMPSMSEPIATPTEADSAPFDWNSLILEQIEANNEGGSNEAVQPTPVEPVAPVAAPIVTEAPVEPSTSVAAPAAEIETAPDQNKLSAAALIDNLGISDSTSAPQGQPVASDSQPVIPQ